MKASVDVLIMEFDDRFKRLIEIDDKFGYLLSIDELFKMDLDDLRSKCLKTENSYKNDIDGAKLFLEINNCKNFINTREGKIDTPIQLLQFIVKFGEESAFPNLETALRIFLTIAISNATCERSFSKLKLILTYLRASMGQGRLNDLALLSIERDIFEETDFSQVINEFAEKKARRVPL